MDDNDVKLELERLKFDPDEQSWKQSVNVSDLLESSLIEGRNIFGLIDRLFDYESPYIMLGNDMVYEKSVDFYGSKRHIYLQGKNAFDGKPLLSMVGDDNGLNTRVGSMAWRHRTDIGLLDLAVLVAKEYGLLHEMALEQDLEFANLVARHNNCGPYCRVTVGDFDKTPVVTIDYPIPTEIEGFRKLIEVDDFYSIFFRNSILNSGIAGDIGYCGCFEKYEKDKGMIVVQIPSAISMKKYTEDWINNLVSKTSFFSDPEYSHLGNHLKSLGASKNLLLE